MTMETTMSSLDFWNNIISSSRKMANEPVSTYQNFFTKVMDELDLEEEDVEKHNSEKINNLGFKVVYKTPVVMLNYDQMMLVGMRESKAIGVSNNRQALSSLDDNEKNTVSLNDGNRGNPNTLVISEGGMYTLVLRCRQATTEGTAPHAFRKWELVRCYHPFVNKRNMKHLNLSMTILKTLFRHIDSTKEFLIAGNLAIKSKSSRYGGTNS